MAHRKLKAGDSFESVSKFSDKNKPLVPQIHTPNKDYREGFKGYFEYGKRKYYCEVLAMTGMEIKWHYTYFSNQRNNKLGHAEMKYKEWRYTYLLKVLET